MNRVDDTEFSWVSEMSESVASVYMGQPYQTMLAKNDISKSLLLKCRVRGETGYLPMLIRDLGDGCKEAYSAYGYGGLIGNLTLHESDVDILRRFLATASILALFVRHSPFLSNQNQWPPSSTELNRYTYATSLRLTESFDEYLKEIPQKLRWSVNYARRAGLQVTFLPLSVCPTEHIKAFYKLYSDLMQQKQTSSYYLFSEEFFIEHSRALDSACELAEIVDKETGKLLAGAFFLLDEAGWAHYHLSAATPGVMKLQGMELLIASALQRYGNNGYNKMHLGGGHALDESDGLSRFKSKFSTEHLNFCCTKLVCDESRYQDEREKMVLKNPSYFLIADARGQ
jgi:hypothetical protein